MQPGNLMLSGTISSQVSSPTALYYLPVTYNRALILNVSNSTSLSGVPSQLSALAALDALLDRPGKIVRGQHDALGNHPIPAVSSLTGLGRLLLVDNQASAIDLQPHCAPLFLRVDIYKKKKTLSPQFFSLIALRFFFVYKKALSPQLYTLDAAVREGCACDPRGMPPSSLVSSRIYRHR
eukprot:TRINITY_DN4158_c0_g1_i3.p1 TRINITY_DN4158_c0_g1~~TRINITY_DN4158_c0_g1_i3.p1  ORF type:complete len:180 (-),score=16.44 TRINITY_DN4158_c0_g1_i3:119-658(-)